GGGITLDQTDGGTRIKLRILPGSAGSNRAHVDLYDRRGEAVNNASSVTVHMKYLDVDLGETAVTALPAQGGGYDAPNIALSIAGRWQAQVQVTRPDAADATAATRFTIGGPAAGRPRDARAAARRRAAVPVRQRRLPGHRDARLRRAVKRHAAVESRELLADAGEAGGDAITIRGERIHEGRRASGALRVSAR